MRFSALLFACFVFLSSLFAGILSAQPAAHVVISEVYGGGGNSGAEYRNDFIELYNPTESSVDLSGWSVQYGSSSGTSWQITPLTGQIAAHGYYLIQEAEGAGGTVSLPVPDATGQIKMGGTNGKVALVNSTSPLSGANPSSYVDLIGYGTANGYEGSGTAPALSNTTSAERKARASSTASSLETGGADDGIGNGYDTDDNVRDFVAQSVIYPQNSASPTEPSSAIPGAGIGTAVIFPSTICADSVSNFTIKIASDERDTIASVVVVIPGGFNWARSITGVSVSGAGATRALVAVDHDTISISQVRVTHKDTAFVVIGPVTAPDSSLSTLFIVKTAVSGTLPLPVGSKLSVSVRKLVRIIDLHANDSQGVPVAPYGEGAVVTVTGVVTAITSNSQTNLFIQDATAGINIFSYTYFPSFQVGDSVTFTGTIDQYRGTTEVVPDSGMWTVQSHGRSLPEPLLVTAADVNQTFTDDYSEPNEGRLVRINDVTYDPGNETITDITGTTGGYIPNLWVIPSGTFDLIGILKQYKPGTASLLTPPYTTDYEIVPRAQDDIVTHAGPTFREAPFESNIQPHSITIAFRTETVSAGKVKYGITKDYIDSVSEASTDTVHGLVLSGLRPATVYHYQVAATDPKGTNQTGDAVFSTASPVGSTGAIDVFFSKSADTSVSRGEKAQTIDIASKFISRISAAKHSIDVALYSLSGSVGSSIASALISAKERGVRIRLIMENDNAIKQQTASLLNTLRGDGIQVITDTFDPINAGMGLMHNKFAVFDFRDTSSFTDDWVWTGSWNATDPGTNDDAQNALEIQDKALANAYTMEFNEMWGSSTDTPNPALSRFGSRKTDNTPHKFNIGGIPVELYFSPSDQTTLHIYRTLSHATSSINVCMLTFTRSDLSGILAAKKVSGQKVRVILDNNSDSGNQFNFLRGAGVDVNLKGSSLTGLLHHKYALIDAEDPKADEAVITGSHNWSNSAETSNNENTLIIRDARVANLYLQEFKARYIEAGGSDDIELGVRKITGQVPSVFTLGQNFPNPFNPTTTIQFGVSSSGFVELKVFDVLGREVRTLVARKEEPGLYEVRFDGMSLPSGIYFCRLRAGAYTSTLKMLLLK